MIHLLFIEEPILQITKTIFGADPDLAVAVFFNSSGTLYRQGNVIRQRESTLFHLKHIQIFVGCSGGQTQTRNTDAVEKSILHSVVALRRRS